MPEKLEWNGPNLTAALTTLLERASQPGEDAFRARLLDLDTGKEELANLIETPFDWAQRVVIFESFEDLKEADPDRSNEPFQVSPDKQLLLVGVGRVGRTVQIACKNSTRRVTLRPCWEP